MTVVEIKKAILDRDLKDLVNELFFERVPFLFEPLLTQYSPWRCRLSAAINVDPCEIVVIGSAAIGFSLSPAKAFRPFDTKSDVDVAIISDHFFSEAWHHLRTVDITIDSLTPAQRAAVIEHQKKYVYWGCIATDRILSLLPFSREWLAARSNLAAVEPTAERIINFRLYKDFRALRAYQALGLKRLRMALLDPEGGYNAAFP